MFQTLSNLGTNSLHPTRIGPNEREAPEKVAADGEETAVESAVHLEIAGYRYPVDDRRRKVAFATNFDIA
ncbi:hypothetical protein [Haloarcula pellucida]|uniref:Uncharacterized protein n=1 Tax=Haloarcula pellucida TaxID=1427151 RepID=A0A830GIQ5_9EURY|nr:hypothetical protein [Halomicroarcula pellucida]MBX0350431.1 hypothetical protein [Halomicroarcula pellucida]GGN90948.1 hypothetical protein GCM10009030_13450 [Halomicroarcula pellucida]